MSLLPRANAAAARRRTSSSGGDDDDDDDERVVTARGATPRVDGASMRAPATANLMAFFFLDHPFIHPSMFSVRSTDGTSTLASSDARPRDARPIADDRPSRHARVHLARSTPWCAFPVDARTRSSGGTASAIALDASRGRRFRRRDARGGARRREHHRGWHRVVVACAVTGAAALAIGYALGDAGVLARHPQSRHHHHHHRHRGRRKMHDHRESHRAHHRDDDGDDGNDRAVASPKVVVNKYPSPSARRAGASCGRAASLAVSSLGRARVDAAWDEALKNAPQSCAHAQYRREHDQTSMSESERALLRNVTYVKARDFGDSKSRDREPLAYLKGLRDTPCETGGFGMNVVFVQDSSKMCNYVMRLYHRGLQDGGKFKFGRGAATCLVMSPNEFEDVTPAGCEDDQFELHKIWYNKVGLTQRIAQKIEDGELSGDFKASHYFWLDGDIARGVVGAVDASALRAGVARDPPGRKGG